MKRLPVKGHRWRNQNRQLGVTQPVEREGKSSAGFGITGQSGECWWRTRLSDLYKQTGTDHPTPRYRIFSREATGTCSTFRFLGNRATRRNLRTLLVQGDLYGQRLQEQSFKHEVQKPSIHDKGLPFPAKEVGNHSRILNIFNENIKDQCVDMENVHVFVNETAIHLGRNYLANLEVYKNTNFEEIQSLFNITQKMILEHSEEILNVNTIKSASPHGKRSVLSLDQVVQWTRAKVRVYLDSVLCLVNVNDSKDAITRWEGQVEEFCFLLQILQKIQDDLRERNIEPEKFTDRIIFMSRFNDIDQTTNGKWWNLYLEFSNS